MIEKIEIFLKNQGTEPLKQGAVAAYVDIDRFKDVNDTLGHDAGDQLIKLVARRLKETLRTDDFLARFGGDEFVVLYAPATADAASALAERVARAFDSPVRRQRPEHPHYRFRWDRFSAGSRCYSRCPDAPRRHRALSSQGTGSQSFGTFLRRNGAAGSNSSSNRTGTKNCARDRCAVSPLSANRFLSVRGGRSA